MFVRMSSKLILHDNKEHIHLLLLLLHFAHHFVMFNQGAVIYRVSNSYLCLFFRTLQTDPRIMSRKTTVSLRSIGLDRKNWNK